jgi:hypothetical protein
MSRVAILIALIVFARGASAEVPSWYAREIPRLVDEASAVIVYQVLDVSHTGAGPGPYHLYQVNTITLQAIKGVQPVGSCYWLQTEGEWEDPPVLGDMEVAILSHPGPLVCGVIESGHGAPATDEYLELFRAAARN